jgi:hypothetical protein
MSLYALLYKLAVSRLAIGAPALTHTDLVNPARLKDRVFAKAGGATPVRIDEVAERFFGKESREGWTFTRDFGDVTPPFDLFFLEGGRPARVTSETGNMDPELVPRSWGVLFEVVNEENGWSGAEMDALKKAMDFERSRTALIYAVNFIGDEEGINFIRADGEGRLYHRLKDRVYLWAQTWFFPLDEKGYISRHPHQLLAPAYRGVRREWLDVFTKRLHLMCFPALYALGRLNAGLARLERQESEADNYRLEDVGGERQLALPRPAPEAGTAPEHERFSDALEACGGLSGDEIGSDMECVKRLVGRDPSGAGAYVEFCCSDGTADLSRIRLAAAVAKGYEAVFNDPLLVRRVYKKAKEAGASGVVELLTAVEGEDGTTGSIN